MKRTVLGAAVAAVLLAGAAQAATTEFIIYKGRDFQGPQQVVKGEVANLEGGFAREGSSLIVRGGYWEVCSDHHFGGNCRVIEAGEYPSLPDHWNDRIVSVRFLGTDNRLAQRVAMEDRKEARREWLAERREERREVREERRARRALVELYGRPEFRGRSLTIDSNTRDLAEADFDGRASSIVVHSGTWQACTEPRYSGRCETLTPGNYPRLAGLDDRISSIRRIY